ncbi:MAG TPA: hydroxylamine reductase, partial [Anaerolineae bacterium]|nr:hydroxylamine reductase [Anaerolineae bacterium]
MDMFCYQCQETAKNEGCTITGMCGKPAEVAQLQDLLIWLLKGISFWGVRGRALDVVDPETDLFVAKALFATITNANFDPDRFVHLIREAIERREALRQRAQAVCRAQRGSACNDAPPDHRGWIPAAYDVDTLTAKGREVGVMADPALNPDIRSLRELLIYGLKGLAAYTEHAYVLEHSNDALLAFMQEVLDATTNDELTAEDLVALVLRTGQMGVEA